jgi:hypothetical protein
LQHLQDADYFHKREDSRTTQQTSISAQLIGSHQCEALGIVARRHAPALMLCRQLIEAGVDPDTALAVYRNGVLSLRIRSLREGAKLAVEDDKNGTPRFRPARPGRGGASPLTRSLPNFDRREGGRA